MNQKRLTPLAMTFIALLLSPQTPHTYGASKTTLVTNDYAYRHPTASDARHSPDWVMTAGSLYKLPDGRYWTGIPDGISSDAGSIRSTNSAVFRMVSKRRGYQNEKITIDFNLGRLISTPKTPKQAWDGVHLFLRYQSQYQLYYASISRRDGTTVIKKKCPGGPSNGGTYHDLSPYVRHPVLFNTNTRMSAAIQNVKSNVVRINLYDASGSLIVFGEDHGIGCKPILSAGGFGVRGDNAEFTFTLNAKPIQ